MKTADPPQIRVKFKETPPKLVDFHIHSPQNRWIWSTPPPKNIHPLGIIFGLETHPAKGNRGWITKKKHCLKPCLKNCTLFFQIIRKEFWKTQFWVEIKNSKRQFWQTFYEMMNCTHFRNKANMVTILVSNSFYSEIIILFGLSVFFFLGNFIMFDII